MEGRELDGRQRGAKRPQEESGRRLEDDQASAKGRFKPGIR